MLLRELYEAPQSVGVIFGRFNPPHKGHRAAWEMLSENSAWYVGTNKSTQGPKDPLPYDVKIKAMQAIWPEVAKHIVPHQSWLTLASDIYKKHGDVELKVYTDEAWVLKTLNQYNGVEKGHGFYNFPKITSIPTPRLSSATALRTAVANNDPKAFADAAGVPADTPIDGKSFFDLVAEYLGQYKKENASPDEENEFHKKLDKLVHKTFGHSSDEEKEKSKKKVKEGYKLQEALDNPYPFKLSGPSDSQGFVATAQTPNGTLRMDIETTDYDNFGIDFAVGKSMGKTQAGDEFRVFATVVAMMKKWINTVGIEHVESFDFAANKDEHTSDGRARLYARFAKQLASQLGWKLEQSTTANNSHAFFKLTNPKPVPRDDEYWDALEENFAKDSITSIKLIKKYQQTGKDEDAFAAIKHGWNFIKNPKMRSMIVNLVKKVSTENGYPEWNDTVAYIKKNTGIDVSNVNENFADGKKKGKSRPGRVKKSGASCNGSVTDLRKRAKNASGEKAKMYHWCANMKSGRKKK